jgi:hypothetical protein
MKKRAFVKCGMFWGWYIVQKCNVMSALDVNKREVINTTKLKIRISSG